MISKGQKSHKKMEGLEQMEGFKKFKIYKKNIYISKMWIFSTLPTSPLFQMNIYITQKGVFCWIDHLYEKYLCGRVEGLENKKNNKIKIIKIKWFIY